MKKGIKTCCCLGLTLLLALSGAREVNAADHCGATKVSCGSWVANAPIESHRIYVNGQEVACQRTKEIHLHTISCTGCGAVLRSNVSGTCIIKHTSICPTEVGDCQSLR